MYKWGICWACSHGSFWGKKNEKNLSVQLTCTNLSVYMGVYWGEGNIDKGE